MTHCRRSGTRIESLVPSLTGGSVDATMKFGTQKGLRSMTFGWPKFDDCRLSGVTACACFHAEKPYAGGASLPYRVWSSYLINDNQDEVALVRAIVESEDETHYHVHVDVDREEVAELSDSLALVPLAEVESWLIRFIDQSTDVFLSGRYNISQSDLPRRGLVETLSGFETESCGSILTLRGAAFDVDGDTFTNLKWSLDEDSGILSARISADTETIIDENYLLAATELLHQGLECFILESPNKPKKDDQVLRQHQKENKRTSG